MQDLLTFIMACNLPSISALNFSASVRLWMPLNCSCSFSKSVWHRLISGSSSAGYIMDDVAFDWSNDSSTYLMISDMPGTGVSNLNFLSKNRKQHGVRRQICDRGVRWDRPKKYALYELLAGGRPFWCLHP
jgi:hypothetical protein